MRWVLPALRARWAQDRVEDLEGQLRAEYEHRARAVREAIDTGAPFGELAQGLGLARGIIYKIVGTAPQ
jgi:transposase-like protein